MESETAAAARVFVRTFSSSPRAYQPLFFCTGCRFWTLMPFLSVFVTFSLSLFSLTYKNRVITGLQGAITSVIQGSFMWRLGLKNGLLLLPPINHVCLLFNLLLAQKNKKCIKICRCMLRLKVWSGRSLYERRV